MASNSKKKIKAIDYTSRDFDSIKTSLVNYAKRYYADSFKDFNEASFGALVLDSVSYIGDILSFYLDYQVNESFLDTAVEYDNVVRIARQLGWKYTDSSTSTGTAQFYVTIPADSSGAPDSSYYPTLRVGSQNNHSGRRRLRHRRCLSPASKRRDGTTQHEYSFLLTGTK